MNDYATLQRLFANLETHHGVRVKADEPLGEGTYSLVYAGVLLRNNERATAVKILKTPVDPNSPAYCQERQVVAKWLGPLGHLPNVLTLLDGPLLETDGRGDSRFVTCWERAEQFLADLQRTTYRHGMPRETLFPVLRDVAFCLDDFAGLGLQHRDIKPENTALRQGRAKVGDPATLREVGASLTNTGSEHGTYEYMPPEAFYGEESGLGAVSNTFDRYSFGVMYANVRLGRTVFSDGAPRQNPLQYALAVRRRKLEQRMQLDGLDADERDFVLRLTRPDPDERPDGAVKLADLFQALGPRPSAGIVAPPLRPSEVRIVEYRVDVDCVTPESVDVAPAPATDDPFAPPPLPREVLEKLGRVQGLEQTIRRLQDGSHPDLKRGQEQVTAALAQRNRLEADLEAHPMKFTWWDAGKRKQIVARVEADPNCSIAELCRLGSADDQDALLDYIFRLRNFVLARQTHLDADQAFRQIVPQQVQAFKQQLEAERSSLLKSLRVDFERCLRTFFDRLQRPELFPIPEWRRLKPHLLVRHYPWNEQQLLEMAERVHREGNLNETTRQAARTEARPARWRFLARRRETPQPLEAPFAKDRAEAARRNWAAERSVPEFFTNSLGMTFVLIPPGGYWRGAREYEREAGVNERPRHWVRINEPFFLSVSAVTRGQVRTLIHAGRWRSEGNWESPGFDQSDDHPAVNLSWDEAHRFALSLNDLAAERSQTREYRLPWEAEWEYAARAGTETRYYSGDDPEGLVRIGNVADATAKRVFADWPAIDGKDGYVYTAPVSRFERNAFGLCDMLGNQWEWQADWYDEHFYAHSPVDDPRGPDDGTERVLRGGSWRSEPAHCRCAYRHSDAPMNRSHDVGFRLACTLRR